MAKSNEIKDLQALLSESNIDAEIESILEELGGDETAEKTGEVEETSPLKDSTTDGSVLDQDPSTKDAIDSGLDEPGVAADNEVVIPDEDKKVDVVITVEKDKEPTIDAKVEETVDAGVDETVDKRSAELNQSELGESFTNIYNILSDNINDIDEKSFEADYNEYKDDGKECVSVDQTEGKECDTECLKDTDIKTDIEASKLNESDDEDKDDDKDDDEEKDEKNDKGKKKKEKKALKNIDDGVGAALGLSTAGYGAMKAVENFNKAKEARADVEEVAKVKTDRASLNDKQKVLDSIDNERLPDKTYADMKKEISDIRDELASNKFADKTDKELETVVTDAKGAEAAANLYGSLAAAGAALGLGKTIGTAIRRIKDRKKKLDESEDVEPEDKSDAIEVLKDLIDVHGDENALIITKKGEFDKPGVAMIKVKVTKEQCDALKPEFCEEKEETVHAVTESQVALMIARENKDRLFSELVEATALANRLQNAICEKYADLAKDRAASLNEELSVWNDTFEDKVDTPAQPLIEERYVTLDELCEILDESGYAVNEESLANLIIDIINEDVVLDLSEASSAEKRAYKDGGEDMSDLVTGKAIARIKDEKSRDAAVAAKKAGRDDVVKSFTGDRKEQQAERSIEKKFEKMQKAGADDVAESGKETEEKYVEVAKEPIKEEVKNVRMAKTASEVNNFYTTDFSEKKDSCDKECEDKENCDCFTVTKDVDNHTDVDLSDASANTPEKGNVDAEESDWFDKDESVDVKEVIVESEEFDSVAKEFLEENDYEVDDENVSLIKEAFINGSLANLDENLTESFLVGKMYAKKEAALTAKINKKRESEKDATKELAKLDKVINKARANGVSIDYADVDGRVSLSMI